MSAAVQRDGHCTSRRVGSGFLHQLPPALEVASAATNDPETRRCVDFLSFLGWNEVARSGAIQISQGLRANAALRILDISDNGIGEVGASHMGYALTENQVLTELDLSHNNVGSKACLVSTPESCSAYQNWRIQPGNFRTPVT